MTSTVSILDDLKIALNEQNHIKICSLSQELIKSQRHEGGFQGLMNSLDVQRCYWVSSIELGHFDKLLKSYLSKSLEEKTKLEEALGFEIAYCYYRLSLLEEGLGLIKRLKQSEKEDQRLLLLECQFFYKMERHEMALESIHQCIMTCSANEDIYNLLNVNKMASAIGLYISKPDESNVKEISKIKPNTYDLTFNMAIYLIIQSIHHHHQLIENKIEIESLLRLAQKLCEEQNEFGSIRLEIEQSEILSLLCIFQILINETKEFGKISTHFKEMLQIKKLPVSTLFIIANALFIIDKSSKSSSALDFIEHGLMSLIKGKMDRSTQLTESQTIHLLLNMAKFYIFNPSFKLVKARPYLLALSRIQSKDTSSSTVHFSRKLLELMYDCFLKSFNLTQLGQSLEALIKNENRMDMYKKLCLELFLLRVSLKKKHANYMPLFEKFKSLCKEFLSIVNERKFYLAKSFIIEVVQVGLILDPSAESVIEGFLNPLLGHSSFGNLACFLKAKIYAYLGDFDLAIDSFEHLLAAQDRHSPHVISYYLKCLVGRDRFDVNKTAGVSNLRLNTMEQIAATYCDSKSKGKQPIIISNLVDSMPQLEKNKQSKKKSQRKIRKLKALSAKYNVSLSHDIKTLTGPVPGLPLPQGQKWKPMAERVDASGRKMMMTGSRAKFGRKKNQKKSDMNVGGTQGSVSVK